MRDFSATQAIGAGFRLVAREPLAFLAWTATYIVICLLPQFGMMALILPEWTRMTNEIVTAGPGRGAFPPSEVFAVQARMMQMQPVVWVTSLVGHSIVLGAIYRAVLFPQDRRFLYLRLSGRELWLGLVILVLFVLMAVLMVVMVLAVGIVVGLIGLATHATATTISLMPLVMIPIAGVAIWVMLRLSMSLPMSFATPGFKLYESWGETRGRAWKMFLVGLAFFAIILLVEMVILAGMLGAVGGFAGLERLSSQMQPPRFDLRTLAPAMIGGGLAAGLFATTITTMFGAAWARIYQELSAEPGPPA